MVASSVHGLVPSSSAEFLPRRAAVAGIAVAAPVLPAFASDELKVTASGLKYYDIKEGTGATPVAGDNVRVHYTGWLNGFEDEAKFDSSYDRRRPLTFPVGTGRVIRGWDETLLTMNVGGTRRVIIPPDLAYGKRGAGGVIPPDATLYFEMTLLSIGG
ncbi:hypothetical protein CTAYLR_003003 [Chrysophaeum taylorii]|uniref:peptidylprolyl isomerase n=1 Tax=Chrysophaeum taylorii TaxID=2483200 RepID=A0AAD7XEN4_9STRA|nr:hypothetical protein CTAYLR_003003 [Chrysophaeum taylorii]